MTRYARNALITGCAHRVGREIAVSLAHQGWNIAVHYHHSKDAAEALCDDIRALEKKAFAFRADLTNDAETSALISHAGGKLGTLSCLINNASLFEKDSLQTMNDASRNAHMQVNCFAPLTLIRDFVAQADRTIPNHIINLVDGCFGWSVAPHYLSYALSKQSLASATILLARELAPSIQINAIGLGATLAGKEDTPETFDRFAQVMPLKRNSSPREVCDTVQYLLNAPSVTGQILYLNGGLHLLPQLYEK